MLLLLLPLLLVAGTSKGSNSGASARFAERGFLAAAEAGEGASPLLVGDAPESVEETAKDAKAVCTPETEAAVLVDAPSLPSKLLALGGEEGGALPRGGGRDEMRADKTVLGATATPPAAAKEEEEDESDCC